MDALGVDSLDPGLRVGLVGRQPDLAAGETDRFVARLMDRHGHQGDRNLFARCQQHVHLAPGRIVTDFLG